MIFIICYVIILFLFVAFLITFSKLTRKRRFHSELNATEDRTKIIKEVYKNYEEIFDSNYKEIISPLNGFIKKEYLEQYLKKEVEKNQKSILVQILPVNGNLTEQIASECGNIINIEFNSNCILACEINDTEPNYIFWIYISDMDEKNGEIFVINTVERLMEFTGLDFKYKISNFDFYES